MLVSIDTNITLCKNIINLKYIILLYSVIYVHKVIKLDIHVHQTVNYKGLSYQFQTLCP